MTFRVLHVIARINVGGTASFLTSLTQMEGDEWEQLIATGEVEFPELEDPRISTMPVIRIPKLGRRISLFRDLSARRRIRRLIDDYKPHVVVSHTFKAGILTRLICTKIPKIHIFHGHLLNDPEFNPLQKRVIIFFEKFLAKRTQMLVTTGDNVRRDLVSAGIHHQNWRNIQPGINPLATRSKEEAMRELALKFYREPKLIIAWHSRFAPVKNAQLVMEIASRLEDCDFIMSGGGPLLEKYRLAHPPNVHLVGWNSPENVLNAADIVISTSFNEGLPLTLVEASMLGKPCIASNVGSVDEIIIDGVTGFLVSNNVEEFVKRIMFFKADYNKVLLFGSQARIHALSRFTRTLFYKNYQSLLYEVINPKEI